MVFATADRDSNHVVVGFEVAGWIGSVAQVIGFDFPVIGVVTHRVRDRRDPVDLVQ